MLISIHALRGEGDIFFAGYDIILSGISIHALRGEGDNEYGLPFSGNEHISIHALRGEGDVYRKFEQPLVAEFQSTPSVGRATFGGNEMRYTIEFQSTPSVGRATRLGSCIRLDVRISIHALRGEGDREQAF